jgi:hypothetical protein
MITEKDIPQRISKKFIESLSAEDKLLVEDVRKKRHQESMAKSKAKYQQSHLSYWRLKNKEYRDRRKATKESSKYLKDDQGYLVIDFQCDSLDQELIDKICRFSKSNIVLCMKNNDCWKNRYLGYNKTKLAQILSKCSITK